MKKLLLSLFVVFLFVIYSLSKNQSLSQSPATPPIAFPSPTADRTNNSSNGNYKNGQYTGDSVDAFYGNVQVQTTVQNGKITDVQFLQYPSDRMTSRMINMQAIPMLKQEVIQAQNANVDIVSGATDTSQAFIQSLTSALNQAK